MRRIVCRELGPLENLAVEELDEPEVSAGTILVDVEAAGVNFVDALIVRGEYQMKPRPGLMPSSPIAAPGPKERNTLVPLSPSTTIFSRPETRR